MLIVIYILATIIAMIIGFQMGYGKGARKGLSIGRDMEFYLFATTLKKLRVQSRYADIMHDVEKTYAVEQKNLVQDLTK